MPVRQHIQNNISDSLHKAGARIRLPVIIVLQRLSPYHGRMLYFRSRLRNKKIPTAVETTAIPAEYPAILAGME